MKAILISIRPQWVAKILNRIKKDEVRKGSALYKAINRLIKEQGVAPMLIYCTKGGEILWRHNNLNTFGKLSKDVEKQFCAYGKNRKELDDKLLDFLYKNGIRVSISRSVHATLLNGKVVAHFNATAEEIKWDYESPALSKYVTRDLDEWELCNKSCLTGKEMIEYLGEESKGTDIHINDLEIFDKPKELSEFQGRCDSCEAYRLKVCKLNPKKCDRHLTKAPQSWCYIEV